MYDRWIGLIATIFALAAAASASAASATYDLACVGQSVAAGGAAKPFTMRLSIDRSRKLWCYRDVGCPRVFPVLSAKGATLTLLAARTPRNEADLIIDLNDGTFRRRTVIPARPASLVTVAGTCGQAAYSRIP